MMFIIIFVLHISSAISQNLITTIPNTNDGPGYVFGNEGDENVQIFCEELVGNLTIITNWFNKQPNGNTIPIFFHLNGTVREPENLIGKVKAIGEQADQSAANYQTNFTIVNFTSEFNNSQIFCGPQGALRIFNIGFSVIPSLPLSVPIHTVIEGNDIMVNLSVPGAASPFPPLLSSLWTYESQPLSNGIDITLDTFTITLSNVQRNQSGNYTLTVSNGAGSTTTSFILDVQFGVSGISVRSDRLGVTGGTVTLVGYVNITGNPLPNVTWSGPDDLSRTTGSRFTLTDGEITITDITNDDNGTYMCTISNGIGSPLVISVDLAIAVPPGTPTNVSHMGVTDTMVTLSWLSPSQLGIPSFNYYHIIMTPSPPPDVTLNTTTNTSIIIRRIIPNTMYNVSIRAVIVDDRIGQLVGPSSRPISFTTLVGAPMFEDVSATPSDGNIVINWIFRHTGGQDINDIMIICGSNDNISSQLTNNLMCTDMSLCVDDNLMGSTSVGPVLAGVTYSCSVTAINDNGTDIRNITSIIPSQGIPSAPQLLDTIIGPGQVSFILRTSSPGDNETFQFRINITNNITQMTSLQSFIISNYISYSIYTATIILNNGGWFVFTIITRNRFGQSVVTITTPLLMIESVPILIATTATTTATRDIATDTIIVSSSPSPIPTVSSLESLSVVITLSVGVGVSILMVTVLVSFIVSGIIIRNKNKKSSTTESSLIGQRFISVHNKAYGVVHSPTEEVTNVSYAHSQPPVPAEYETVDKLHSPTEVVTNVAYGHSQPLVPAEYETVDRLHSPAEVVTNVAYDHHSQPLVPAEYETVDKLHVHSLTEVVTNVAYGHSQPPVPAEYEMINKLTESDEYI